MSPKMAESIPEKARKLKTPSFVVLLNPLIRSMLKLGIPMGPNTLLTVQGRKSGKLHTTPVGLFENEGHRYLLATFGNVNWVKNLRKQGEAKIGMGMHRELVSAQELTAQDAAPVFKKVLSHYLESRAMRSFLKMGYDLSRDASDEDFQREALRHPAFELRPK
jgi:deazaflavin-dependent oxidoreductase (nitroreductase family)